MRKPKSSVQAADERASLSRTDHCGQINTGDTKDRAGGHTISFFSSHQSAVKIIPKNYETRHKTHY